MAVSKIKETYNEILYKKLIIRVLLAELPLLHTSNKPNAN